MLDSQAEVIAIIPARGGSKGLPRKNILPLAGKPLIAYSIEAALASKLVTRVVVSTEDEEIAAIAQEYGAEVPFMRPAELADDRAKISEAIKHTLEQLKLNEGYEPNILITLYPTHPFRTPEIIDSLVQRNLDGCRFAVTAKPIDQSHKYICNDNGDWRSLPSPPQNAFRAYGTCESKILNGPATKNYSVLFLEDEVQCIDIDTLEDFLLAEEVINNASFHFSSIQ